MTEHFVFSKFEEDGQGHQRHLPSDDDSANAVSAGMSDSSPQYDVNRLLDELLNRTGSQDDAVLARRLDVSITLLAGLRLGKFPLRPSILLSFAHKTGVPVEELMSLLGERRVRQRMPGIGPSTP